MAIVRTPRGAWVQAGLRALAAGGPDAVRVEPLATALGVSKGGFYWHFADRGALLEEMLDTWERTGTEDIIARVAGHPGDARAKLQKLFDITSSPEGLAVELAVRDWSRRDSDVAGRLRRADNRRMAFVRSLFSPLYRTGTEFAGEISNQTVHGVLQLGWVDRGQGRYQGELAVYVKPRGRFGRQYMAFITPFRRWLVYPAMLRQIERAWADSGG